MGQRTGRLKGMIAATLLALSVSSSCAQAAPLPVALSDCHDGDTCRFRLPARLTAETVELVRIAGLDAPELPGRCPEERAAALAARDFLLARLRAAERVELLELGRDRFGRLLARVLADGEDMASALIAAGLARPYHGGKRNPWCAES